MHLANNLSERKTSGREGVEKTERYHFFCNVCSF